MRWYALIIAFLMGGPAFAQIEIDESVKSPPEFEDICDSPMSVVLTAIDCPPKPKKQWSGGTELGLNGTAGNTDAFNIRMFGVTKREWDNKTFLSDILYNYATADSVVTQDNLQMNIRQEWRCGDSKWNCFLSGGLQYDQFRAFDLLLFSHAGLGFTWWKDDCSFLKTRAGFGGSYPIGGPEEKFAPEALLGLDYEKKMGNRLKYILGGVVYPDLSNYGEYRATVTTALEFLIDPEHNIGFKIGGLDNYISNAQGRRPNDLNYFAALTWKY